MCYTNDEDNSHSRGIKWQSDFRLLPIIWVIQIRQLKPENKQIHWTVKSILDYAHRTPMKEKQLNPEIHANEVAATLLLVISDREPTRAYTLNIFFRADQFECLQM